MLPSNSEPRSPSDPESPQPSCMIDVHPELVPESGSYPTSHQFQSQLPAPSFQSAVWPTPAPDSKSDTCYLSLSLSRSAYIDNSLIIYHRCSALPSAFCQALYSSPATCPWILPPDPLRPPSSIWNFCFGDIWNPSRHEFRQLSVSHLVLLSNSSFQIMPPYQVLELTYSPHLVSPFLTCSPFPH